MTRIREEEEEGGMWNALHLLKAHG